MTPRKVLAACVLAACPGRLSSATTEEVHLTTYYPAPSGVYHQMITTGNTWLAREGGSVGIGTPTPSGKLDVNGTVRVGNLVPPPGGAEPPGADGMIYYNLTLGEFRGFRSGAWGPLGGGAGPVVLAYAGNPSCSKGCGWTKALGNHNACFVSHSQSQGWDYGYCTANTTAVPGAATPSTPTAGKPAWYLHSFSALCNAVCLDW